MGRGINYFIDAVSQEYVEGWAVGPSGRCAIDVLLDGRIVGQATTGLPRHDVGAAFPGVPGSAESGFLYLFTEQDLSAAGKNATVTLRIASDRQTLETPPFAVPIVRQTASDAPLVQRSPFPSAVTDLLMRRSAGLATGDLASEAGSQAAMDVLEQLVRRGPRPLVGVHRYFGYLRTVFGSALFAAKYFPKANTRSTGDKDLTSRLTDPRELAAIAHHLFVIADAGVAGALLEFGCYKGYSTAVLSTACDLMGRRMEVFDSFEGLPATDSSFYRPGEFAGALSEVSRNVAEFGRPEVVTFHPGFFSDSVPRWPPQPVACLWMDVDLEVSAIDALRAFPHLDRRAALFSHECQPASFDGPRPVVPSGPDQVVGPIVDAFRAAGREPVGAFLSGCTGAFWDQREGIPVLPAAAFQRLLDLCME